MSKNPSQNIPPVGTKDYRKLVSDTVAITHDQMILDSNEGKKLQTNWTSWSNFLRNDLSWKCIWALGPNLLRFCVQSTFNTLPSPNNLLRWRISAESSCALCDVTNCTLPHILSGCKFSLNNGRWEFRHDSVLKVLVCRIEEMLQQKQKEPPPPPFTSQFVPEGKNPPKSSRRHLGLLDRAKDWVLLADISSAKLIFPPSIMSTAERPDIVIYSSQIRCVILIENTSGCEENHDENHTIKTEKYNSLVDHIRGTGWKCHFFTIEVGARGFNSSRVPYCLKALGFSPRITRKVLSELSRAALVGSYHIWLARALGTNSNCCIWPCIAILCLTSNGCGTIANCSSPTFRHRPFSHC